MYSFFLFRKTSNEESTSYGAIPQIVVLLLMVVDGVREEEVPLICRERKLIDEAPG